MDELRTIVWLIVMVFRLIGLILRGLYLLVRGLVRLIARPVRALRSDGPGAPAEPLAGAPAPAKLGRPAATSAPARAAPAVADRAAIARVTSVVQELAGRARALEARCADQRLCAPLLPTLREVVLPRLAAAQGDLRGAPAPAVVRRVSALCGFLDALTKFLSVMADQRADPDLDELIDDADALADACYRPVVEYCRANDVPLSSDRTAAVFGDGCSPWLGRIDDPTGLAFVHLPWQWLEEVHRWPAIGHEVGHDFYDSVAGLDDELLRRAGLTELVGRAGVIERDVVTVRDVNRIVTQWREELTADAFGAMMFGPAYAVATAAIFASPHQPKEALTLQVDGDQYEVHPPGHVRMAAVCRLLGRMGFGAQADEMERRWRAQHGDPRALIVPTTSALLWIEDEPFIEAAVALTTALQRDGFQALRGIPLYSMPGFDFGPREHVASLKIRDAFLAGVRPAPEDARLLIAGAVLAWAERPADSARLLRAARLAVGRLDLPVAGARGPARAAPASSFDQLVRDAVLLDVLLTPPRGSLLRR
jgi:hypothetical protein